VTGQTYLVEHYRPGLAADELRRAAAQVRRAVDGARVRHLRTTIVPRDEAFLTLFTAESERLLLDAYGRAGLTFERISLALPDDGS
jgi:hypothetical protein